VTTQPRLSGSKPRLADGRRRTLNDYPTPPWATRAFLAHLGRATLEGRSIVEPAANRGMMAEVLREVSGAAVFASDVEDYGVGYPVGSFVGEGPDVIRLPRRVDWIITNPPFALAEDFLARALDVASLGVAFLLRTSFLEGAARAASVFERRPPSRVVICTERVPIVLGRWDPCVSTAMSYAWFVWQKGAAGPGTIEWIARGARKRFTLAADALRFRARHEFELVAVDGEARDPARLFQSIVAAERSFRVASGWPGSVKATIGEPVATDKFRPTVKTIRVAIEASADECQVERGPLFDEAVA